MGDRFKAVRLDQVDGATKAAIAELDSHGSAAGRGAGRRRLLDPELQGRAGDHRRRQDRAPVPVRARHRLRRHCRVLVRPALRAGPGGAAHRLGRGRAPLGRPGPAGPGQGRLAAAPARRASAWPRPWRSVPPASRRCSACWRWRSRACGPSAARSWSPVPPAASAAWRSRCCKRAGFTVVASSGRPELADYLTGLGAAKVVDRRAVQRRLEGAARFGDLGRCRRLGGRRHAGQSAQGHAVPWRGHGLRPRGRCRVQRHRVPVHPARRAADRHRIRPSSRTTSGPPCGRGWPAIWIRPSSSA